eukprot:TRINITY_DN897_c0_g1_i1.p1 TRINITY_DN897_c0_g1~~TRINITY_DN897_c0_g1_i1.p1  ORF type:complete len:161 (-),score=25.46 TRINITY_DN897_c0_g1_i1:32-484(-)
MARVIASLLLLALCIAAASATNIQVVNKCNYNVNAIKTGNGQASYSLGNLGPGRSLWFNPGSNDAFNIKNGFGGKTLAEFSINMNSWQGHDSYDLSVIVGYDVGMQIVAPFGGFSPICTYSGCPDAYHQPNDKDTHVVNTGGSFSVIFCP